MTSTPLAAILAKERGTAPGTTAAACSIQAAS